MFGDLFRAVGSIVDSVCGIAIAPIAIALGVTEALVKRAIHAGCRTEREIRDWIEENQ